LPAGRKNGAKAGRQLTLGFAFWRCQILLLRVLPAFATPCLQAASATGILGLGEPYH